jgi:hypothetical protein
MTPENHKKLGIAACLPILQKAFPGDALGYFLLGNWFTDVSQGIAPVDYAAGMADARKEGAAAAKKASWFIHYLVPDFIVDRKVNQFVKQLLGDPPPKNSAMAEWFRNAVYVAGWIEFCWEGGPAKKLAASGAGPIDFAEYDRLYHGKKIGNTGEGRFTQYFPHEHFDRWPMDRTEKSDRRVYAYVEDHIRNIAELLTLVQRDWARDKSAASPGAETKRHDLLAEFGYAMHTAEDYWAHTNFVDFAMRSIGKIPENPDERRKQERRVLRDITHYEHHDKQERLVPGPRTEMFAESGATEPETLVVGGYFDGIDTRFSLVQIYKGMKGMLAHRSGQKAPTWKCGARDCGVHKHQADRCEKGPWFCRRLKPACPGHAIPNDSCPDKGGEEWHCGARECPRHAKRNDRCATGTWSCGRWEPRCPGHVAPGQQCPEVSGDEADWRKAKTKEERERYKAGLAAQQTLMGMPQKVRDAELAFIELDWKMIDEWDGKCVSWVLEKMLNEGESYAARQFKDDSRFAERVGSHTLIAKDDETKQPGFEQAMNLAKRVDRYIAETMVKAVQKPKPICRSGSDKKSCSTLEVKVWVDWLELLRYFMGHPDEAQQFEAKGTARPGRGVARFSWWMPAMASGDGAHDHSLKYITEAEANERALLKMRKRLEEEHNSMIRIEMAAYQADYSGDGHKIQEVKVFPTKGMAAKHEQDDMDRGSVRVKCLEGGVKVDLYAAVWSDFRHLASGEISKGEIWSGEFTELSNVYDQTNRAVVTASADGSKYEIIMVSYDR